MTERLKVGLYIFGKNHGIDKYFQILHLIDNMGKNDRQYDVCLLTDGTSNAVNDILAYTDNKYRLLDIRVVSINDLGLNFILMIDPYNKPYIPFKEIKVPIVYKEYGVSGAENGAGYLLRKDIYKYADTIITDNEFMKNKIIELFPDKKDKIVVGSPAFDYVFDDDHYDGRFSPNKRHVLWTPHHSIVKKDCYDSIVGGTYSTFLTYKDYFANQFLEDFQDVVLHIKPHPLLRGRYNYNFGNFNDYLKSFSDPTRVIVHEKEDYHPLFMNSDLIINDSISFIQEWLPTGKPMIVLQDDKQTPYSPYGEELIDKCYYRVNNVRDLSSLVSCLLDTELADKYLNRQSYIRKLYLGEVKVNGKPTILPNSVSLMHALYNMYK